MMHVSLHKREVSEGTDPRTLAIIIKISHLAARKKLNARFTLHGKELLYILGI